MPFGRVHLGCAPVLGRNHAAPCGHDLLANGLGIGIIGRRQSVSIASALPAEHNPTMPPSDIPLIDAHRGEIARLCALTSVRRLDAFGSVVRADFSPERSDIDLVVEFDALPPSALAEAYFTLKENLEALLGRPIDLLTERSLRNPWLRLRVDSERVPIYAS